MLNLSWETSYSRKRQCKTILQPTIRTYWNPAQIFQYPRWKLLAHKQIKKNVMRLLMEILENHWGFFPLYLCIYIYLTILFLDYYMKQQVSSEITPGSDGVESSCKNCDRKDEAEVGITRHVLGSVLAVGSCHPWHVAGQWSTICLRGLQPNGREATKVLANLMTCNLVFHDDKKVLPV